LADTGNVAMSENSKQGGDETTLPAITFAELHAEIFDQSLRRRQTHRV
jgi:hypothetical protein